MIVVYTPRMLAPAHDISPSAAKPEAVVQAWRARFPALTLVEPKPVQRADLLRAHQARYVDDVLALRTPNGFGNHCPRIAASLPYTSGAMLEAARLALARGGAVAAPCSGFHHAGWEDGHGFCTFNGLMVTALALQAARPGLRVGILDYDYHYGDGTADILEQLKPEGIVHITAGNTWRHARQAEGFLANIDEDLKALADCQIVLYQAGADPHIDDPLGGFLDTGQMLQRDRKVFSGLARMGIPVAWNLAGGYQRPLRKVVELHVNSMGACLEAGAGDLGARPSGY